MQRLLWQTIADLVGGALPDRSDDAASPMRVTGVSLDVPLEVVFGPSGLRADVPTWRWRTAFDLPLGRLRLRLVEAEDEA